MIQICGESIIILFKIIFEPSFCEAEFHNTLKKGNKATVYKKEKKLQCFIYGSFIIFLGTTSRSSFILKNFCTAKPLPIIHSIKTVFNSNVGGADVTGVFLVFSKAFNKVLHDELLLLN